MESVFRFPTEEEMAKSCCPALELPMLGYGSDFPLSPVSDASQFSPVLDGESFDEMDLDTSNCVYCGVGLGVAALAVEWDRRVCGMCTRALACPSTRHVKRQGQQFNLGHCHHCGIRLDGAHVLVDGQAYCRFDYESLFVLQCRGCGLGIADSYVEALQSVWHKACFRCGECGACVAEGASFLLDDRILCEAHYYLLRDAVCLLCQQPLKGLCLATPDGKARFHPNHFPCHRCHKPLPPSSFTKESGHFICLDCSR